MIRRNHVWQMLLSVLEASVQEWWFLKTVWCLLIIIVALAEPDASSNLCFLGELSCKISCSREETALHYAGALHLLEKGGFDLGIKKWVELVSLRIENSKKE